MNKTLVVTGATGGIGGYLAQMATDAGYETLGVSRRGSSDLPFPVAAVDVTNPREVTDFFKNLKKKPLWGLINAAGAAAMNLHLTTPFETMRRVIECNLLGTMYCCAEAGKIMTRQKKGRIINFSTIAVALGLAGEASYVAAKAGVEGFTRAFAREMASFGVTVNAVAPGPVPTRLIAGVPQTKIEALRKRQILPRPLTAADVWGVVSWLLDEKSAPVSGEILSVGGV